MRYSFRLTRFFLVSSSIVSLLFAQETYVCIWRNPERTMLRIFPHARDYTTISRDISSEALAQIETVAGPLLPGQREVFQYYELKGEDNTLIGHIFASSQKGAYGAIEFVFGLNLDKKINGIYIQRSRERDKSFRQREFLDQFIGLSVAEILEKGMEANAQTSLGCMAILSGVKKELAAFDQLANQ